MKIKFHEHIGSAAVALLLIAGATSSAQMPFYGNFYLHDPGTMIRDGTNYFIYGDGQGISGITSSDLRNWNATSPIFPGGPPSWTSNAVPGFAGYFWAPDVAWFNGRYNLYYACSQWGTINSAIGLVTTPSLVSPVWTDQGKVIQSNPNFATNATTDLTAYNCIDPSILVDTNGTVWMSFGSYSDGILIMQLDPATGKRISPNSPIYRVSNNGPVFFSNTEEGSCLYQRGGYYYLFVNFGGCCAGVNSTYNIRVGRSTTVTGPYYDQHGVNLTNGGGTMVLESNARFIGPGHPAILNDNGTNWFTYHYYDGNNGGAATVGMNRIYWTADDWPALTNDWSAFYPLNTDGREHLGLYNGALRNFAGITNDPALGKVLNLDGVTNFVSLPLPVANASTFAAWVKWRGGANWQRIFDFGANTTNYFFLTPQAYGGTMRFAITTNGNTAEQQINTATALPTNSWVHVAVTLDGTRGLLYLNGAPAATNDALTIRPWQILARSNYVGKSQWPDPLFAGEIGSFRIFGRALGSAEIRDLAYAHPALAHRYSFSTNSPTAAWDSIGMAHGTLMGNATVTNNALRLTGASGNYVNLPGGLVSGSAAVTLECWATFGAIGNWARVVDFGNTSGSSGIQYFFFSPHTSLGGQRLEMRTNLTTTLDISGTLDNRTVHVACIVDPTNNYAAVYTNGVLEGTLTGSWPAFSSVSTAWSFVGRSLFSADAWLNATIDELRLYDGRLTPAEIAADYAAGPDALYQRVSLTMTKTAGGHAFSWPSAAAGFTLLSSAALGNDAAWSPASGAPVMSNGWYWQTVPAGTAHAFYRLSR
ncbi:MAG TPA: LamG-like jellyroll fold domain-containing protein [Candidatus Acidoferrum sp.]|nr:LamG-like jellyroll fold domain-containing protein [Candidatus Acidoferrum sp.]